MKAALIFLIAIISVVVADYSYSGGCNNHQLRNMKGGPNCSISAPPGSSIIFSLRGNVYPSGNYLVEVSVGNPPKPYSLDPDTGSDLTWLQCNAPCVRCTPGIHPLYQPSNDLVPCTDPLCASLHPRGDECDYNPMQCDYQVEYADGSSSIGVLLNDFFTLSFTSGGQIRQRLTLGCGYDQVAGGSYHCIDGVLGLGKGRSSIVSQLHDQGIIRNVIGHCLSDQGGYLFFGDYTYDASQVTWTPMSSDKNHYAAGSAEIQFGGKSTGLKKLDIVFDSGSSYTYFSSNVYNTLVSLIKKDISAKAALKEAPDDDTLPLCWRGGKPFKTTSDIATYFKSLTLSFSSGWRSKSQYEIPPASYLIISTKGNACLGILNGSDEGLDNVIGDISMLDKLLIYNNEKQAIGWSAANCEKAPLNINDFSM